MTTVNNINQGSANYPETKTEITINAQIDKAFHYIAPINLMHIFRGNAMIPAIVDTSVKEGWNKAGLKRTVFFKDGSTSQESLLTVNTPVSFSYKNENFTSKVLAALLKRLEGEWLFTDLGNGKTKIEWTYRAVPTNFFAKLFVRLVLMRAVRSMLKDAMDIIKNDLESGQLENGTTWKTQS
jgi:ribosome-associated toxin RatA of RatAB toxin-antitoxin module